MQEPEAIAEMFSNEFEGGRPDLCGNMMPNLQACFQVAYGVTGAVAECVSVEKIVIKDLISQIVRYG